MSRAGVGLVIEKLVGDEDLRVRFTLDPVDTLAELLRHGVELSGDEIDLFCRTDACVWYLGVVPFEAGHAIGDEGWYGARGGVHVDSH